MKSKDQLLFEKAYQQVMEANSDWANEAEPKAPTKGGSLMLYVWEDVLTDYTSGMAFAIASSKEEAALLAMNTESRFKRGMDDDLVQELLIQIAVYILSINRTAITSSVVARTYSN